MRAVAGVALLCACACSAPPAIEPAGAPHAPPNIVLISLDACRADHLGCYGYPRDTSPFIDSLAARGTVFGNAFVNTHGTAPSHTTMLTSLYQEAHGISLVTPKPGEADRVPAGALMVQEILRGHGYLTLGVTGGGFMGSALAFDRGFVELDDRPARIPTQTRRLVRLVERYSDVQQPLFLLLHTYETHSPYRAPPEYAELFDSSTSNFEPTTKNLLASVNTADRDLTADDVERLKALVRCRDSIHRRHSESALLTARGLWFSRQRPCRHHRRPRRRVSPSTAACSTAACCTKSWYTSHSSSGGQDRTAATLTNVSSAPLTSPRQSLPQREWPHPPKWMAGALFPGTRPNPTPVGTRCSCSTAISVTGSEPGNGS